MLGSGFRRGTYWFTVPFRVVNMAQVVCGPVALPDGERPSGPRQYGRGVHGQYVYWITMPYAKAATIATHNLKRPDEFTRDAFCELLVKAHRGCGIEIPETAG